MLISQTVAQTYYLLLYCISHLCLVVCVAPAKAPIEEPAKSTGEPQADSAPPAPAPEAAPAPAGEETAAPAQDAPPAEGKSLTHGQLSYQFKEHIKSVRYRHRTRCNSVENIFKYL